jgi:hypothetical protein
VIPLSVRSIFIENDVGATVLLMFCWWHAANPAKTAINATSRMVFIEAPDPVKEQILFDNMKHAAEAKDGVRPAPAFPSPLFMYA